MILDAARGRDRTRCRTKRAETVSQIHVGSGTPGCSFMPTDGMRGAPPPPPPLTGACS